MGSLMRTRQLSVAHGLKELQGVSLHKMEGLPKSIRRQSATREARSMPNLTLPDLAGLSLSDVPPSHGLHSSETGPKRYPDIGAPPDAFKVPDEHRFNAIHHLTPLNTSSRTPLLEARVPLLESRVAELESQLSRLLGSSEADLELQHAVHRAVTYTHEKPPAEVHFKILDSLLKGARPSCLDKPDLLTEVIVRLRIAAVDDNQLRSLYEEVLRRAPSSPYMHMPMQDAIKEAKAVQHAQNFTKLKCMRFVVASLLDTSSDVIMVYLYLRRQEVFFATCVFVAVVGNTIVSMGILWNLDDERRVCSKLLNLVTLGSYCTLKACVKLYRNPSASKWEQLMLIKRGDAFEAGVSLIPNTYSILINGVASGYERTDAELWMMFFSSFSSVYMLSLTANAIDQYSALIKCCTNGTCRHLFTHNSTLMLMYLYRICEACTIVCGVIASAATRPYGWIVFLLLRVSGAGVAWFANQRQLPKFEIPATGQRFRAAAVPGISIFNPFAFHVDNCILLGAFLRRARLVEISLVWCWFAVACAVRTEWKEELILPAFTTKFVLTAFSLAGSVGFICIDMYFWAAGVYDAEYSADVLEMQANDSPDEEDRIGLLPTAQAWCGDDGEETEDGLQSAPWII